jgi:hypothetical protein
VIEDAIDRRLLDLLGQASNRQLLMLHAVIDRMLADPRRIIEIRRHLHLGQTVQFLDWQHGVMLKGQVVALHERQVELRELSARRQWKLPYTAVELPDGPSTQHAEPPAPAAPLRPTRNDFNCGDKVAFEDKYLQTVVGTVVRINQRTATIDPGDGTTWRVAFALLRPAVGV